MQRALIQTNKFGCVSGSGLFVFRCLFLRGIDHVLESVWEVDALTGLCGGVVELMAAGAVVGKVAFCAAGFHGEYIFFPVALGQPRTFMTTAAAAVSKVAAAIMLENASWNYGFIDIVRRRLNSSQHIRVTRQAIARRHFG